MDEDATIYWVDPATKQKTKVGVAKASAAALVCVRRASASADPLVLETEAAILASNRRASKSAMENESKKINQRKLIIENENETTYSKTMQLQPI